MSEQHRPDNKSNGIFGRLRNWTKSLVQDAPSELAVCEFDCSETDCLQGKWETCEKRVRGMVRDQAGD